VEVQVHGIDRSGDVGAGRPNGRPVDRLRPRFPRVGP
jgi:hypothetical protein